MNAGLDLNRRQMLSAAATAAAVLALGPTGRAEAEKADPFPILDSHVHVWDRARFRLPWLDHNLPVLQKNYSPADYRAATQGLNVTAAVYVEVNVEPGRRADEAKAALALCREPGSVFAAAVIAADPTIDDFSKDLSGSMDDPAFKGVRFLYPKDASADATFVNNLRWLGERRRSFDLQLGPALLADAARTARACSDTQFVLNHCGGADARHFRRESDGNSHAGQVRDAWLRGIEALAACPNVACKISGVADSALPGDATRDDVAPIVRHCLEQFGPDRVLFGGNWPVCLKGTTLRHWVTVLKDLQAANTRESQNKLFGENARKVYRLNESPGS